MNDAGIGRVETADGDEPGKFYIGIAAIIGAVAGYRINGFDDLFLLCTLEQVTECSCLEHVDDEHVVVKG